MKSLAAAAAMSFAAVAPAVAEERRSSGPPTPSATEVGTVSPALDKYLQGTLLGEVWERPGLSARDRSVVTVAALIARNQAVDMPAQLERALDNGVTPAELSEIVTHLAFYSGFPNAMSAVGAAQDVFARRGIGADQLPPASPELLPQDAEAEAAREKTVFETVGPVSQGVVHYTDMLFDEVWQRPGLAPRDRSLVTVSALIVNGQTAQVGFHLAKAMDNGLTKEEASETLTQLAFYGGWPNVFSAVPVAKEVFDKRGG
jgi:4-carboxymuconolactone decarboxylase